MIARPNSPGSTGAADAVKLRERRVGPAEQKGQQRETGERAELGDRRGRR